MNKSGNMEENLLSMDQSDGKPQMLVLDQSDPESPTKDYHLLGRKS